MAKHWKPAFASMALLLTGPGGLISSAHANTSPQLEQNTQYSAKALISKGVYWYERFRFDLATQQFNRVLLIDPANPSALRWQGMVDLARGDVQAAEVWLRKLRSVAGPQDALTQELLQAVELGSNKRQKLAELRYLADSERKPKDLSQRLLALFEQEPVGEAALQIYRIMAKTPEGRAVAAQRLQGLSKRFPQDPRYGRLLTDLGMNSQQLSGQKLGGTRLKTKPVLPPVETSTETETAGSTNQPAAPVLSNFEQGQALSEQAKLASDKQDFAQAIRLLEQAVGLNPDYPWFRFDLANAMTDEGGTERLQQAKAVMDEGLKNNNAAEMRFASALLAARHDRDHEALDLLNGVPKTEWTAGMTALDKRINYGQYLDTLRTLEQQERYNLLASSLYEPNPWRAEPEVAELQQMLSKRMQVRLRTAYENATIDGSEGVSKIDMLEIPAQLDLPIDFEKKLFLRMDHLHAKAGTVNPTDATNFAQLGTTTPNDPAISQNLLNQNFKGQLVGVGLETSNMRLDLGTTVGNLPVNNWVGGVQWRVPVGAGSIRFDLARRMVGGSVLSSTGAIDPLTGQAWGGARRNGVSAVYYTPLNEKTDFVGIAKANQITGKHMPDNTELNLQGILSRTVYQTPGHKVEVGGSLYLWSFKKNLRFYTYGQGGYYSPQAFGSLTFPITWTGNTQYWSWRIQGSFGASESREDATELYPLDPQLAAAAALQNNAVRDTGGPGGGTSTGLRGQIEHQVSKKLVMGALVEIDRSEGYNPDRIQVYLKYSFGDAFEFSIPPEGVTPYSRF